MVTRIGVLASQGAFAEHIAMLQRLEAEAIPVRLPEDLNGLDGLIIPGGESTTISKMMADYGLTGPIKEMAQHIPVFGTCAGMILMAKALSNRHPEPLGLLDIGVKRNAFGRQRESFEADIPVLVLGQAPFHAIFIRAPVIERVSDKVEVLARLGNGAIVAVREGKMLATAFHPELTDDVRFHRYFLDIITAKR